MNVQQYSPGPASPYNTAPTPPSPAAAAQPLPLPAVAPLPFPPALAGPELLLGVAWVPVPALRALLPFLEDDTLALADCVCRCVCFQKWISDTVEIVVVA